MHKVLIRTPRFVERVFTARERAYCDGRGLSAPKHYAARFAAKEAALKALGTGWAEGVAWQDIEVTLSDAGAPALRFYNRALELYEARGATRSHLSISHTSEHAVAQVILEK